MGGSVSSFIGNVAKTVAKGATTALGGMIPVIGPSLASGVNSLYAKGGKVLPRFEAGGEVPAGMKAKVINTPAELIRVIKAFPAEASKANLSVQDVKDAVAELKMARGGEVMAHGGEVGGHMMPDGKMYYAKADGGRVNMAVGFPYGVYDAPMGGIKGGLGRIMPSPANPGRGQMMMYGRGGEASMAMGGMSGQRMARGRGGGIN